MTPDAERLRDAYLAELWPVCREVPYGERVAKRKADHAEQWLLKTLAGGAEAPVVPARRGTEVA